MTMYIMKRNKICPFCRGRIKKLNEMYKCENCGAVLKPEVMDTRSLNSVFFSDRR